MNKTFGFKREEYIRHPEAAANKYTLHGMSVAVLLLCVVWILNILNIFMVDQKTIATAATLALVIYVVGMVFFAFLDLRERWVKYLLIFWVFAIVTVLTTFLTFHAYIVCVLPIIYSCMYSTRKIMVWAYVLTVIGIIITVYVGYENGICDTNMALLSGKPLAQYIGENGQFLLTKVNDRTEWTLPLFFVVPRSLICLAITLSCYTISKIIRNSIKYTQELEALAEIDEMTGVYNRNKYLTMTSEGYTKEDKIAVIFWDINYLKEVNDTMGHEKGDALIKTIANAIRNVSSQFDHAYRIGGDEFVMIMRGGDELHAKKKIAEWEEALEKLEPLKDIPISASYGYAFGKGSELEEIIRNADKMMYENKREFHESKPM